MCQTSLVTLHKYLSTHFTERYFWVLLKTSNQRFLLNLFRPLEEQQINCFFYVVSNNKNKQLKFGKISDEYGRSANTD